MLLACLDRQSVWQTDPDSGPVCRVYFSALGRIAGVLLHLPGKVWSGLDRQGQAEWFCGHTATPMEFMVVRAGSSEESNAAK